MENLLVVNNTGLDITGFYGEINESIKNTGELPDELQDIFTLELIDNKAIINCVED